MIKVEKDPKLLDIRTVDALEIVQTRYNQHILPAGYHCFN